MKKELFFVCPLLQSPDRAILTVTTSFCRAAFVELAMPYCHAITAWMLTALPLLIAVLQRMLVQ